MSLSSIVYDELTPVMKQWYRCKKEAGDSLLLFRMGDFFEAFYEDAIQLASICSLALTKRQGIPMSGMPHHFLDSYLDKLVGEGLCIAIAEQDSKSTSKGLIDRKIVRRVSPATHLSKEQADHNFFCSIFYWNQHFGLASMDLSTQELSVIEVESQEELYDQLDQKAPSELLLFSKDLVRNPTMKQEIALLLPKSRVIERGSSFFDPALARERVQEKFGPKSLSTFSLDEKISSLVSVGALLQYLSFEWGSDLSQLNTLKTEEIHTSLCLDRTTDRHLEISSSLFTFCNRTSTGMGARLLKRWIQAPLIDLEEILKRQEAILELKERRSFFQPISKALEEIRDLERLAVRLGSSQADEKDLLLLLRSLRPLKKIYDNQALFQSSPLIDLSKQLSDPSPLILFLESALDESRAAGETLFRKGYHPELDSLIEMKNQGSSWLVNYQEELRHLSGIKSLKVQYNRAFGYSIEVPRSQSERVPSHFLRRQTLLNVERFTTEALQQYEERELSGSEQLVELEKALLKELFSSIQRELPSLRLNSQLLAKLDAFFSLAKVAEEEGYTRPLFNSQGKLDIQEGRHPLVEKTVPLHTFVSNSLDMSPERTFGLITGPNMGGKSTFMRQNGLIIVLAQIGSFVPAKKASLPLFRRIFSRIGANDDLMRGHSTFMVEMIETARILHNVSQDSFVILDEIGRGTSTFDGISIAWAVVEFLLSKPGVKALFATHYTELTKLKEKGLFFLEAKVCDSDGQIRFLHQIESGIADKSYGIHVAQLAGLPPSVVQRAQTILKQFEEPKRLRKSGGVQGEQLVLFNSV